MIITGTIIRGEGIGKTLGYPTANIDIPPEKMHLTPGVYAAIAILGGQEYHAALVIMSHPWKVESHLIGYSGPDVYGEELTVEPVQRVSTLERYNSTEELKKKIAADIVLVRECLERPEES